MGRIVNIYKNFFADKKIMLYTLSAFWLLAISVIVNFYAWRYASISQSNAVTDLILSNIPTYNVDYLFVYGTFVAFIWLLLYCGKNPFQVPYIIKTVALFVLIRCWFIILTHIGPDPSVIYTTTETTWTTIFSHFSFSWDLFFSGHTWLPFLLALLFWKNKILRYVCLFITIAFAVIVLLGHLHYSIDVLSAFFIAYGIYHMSMKFFSKEKKYFDSTFSSTHI